MPVFSHLALSSTDYKFCWLPQSFEAKSWFQILPLQEHGVFCTSVEPRERKLTKAQRKSLAEKGVRLPRESTPPVLPQNLVGAHRRELFADDEYWADAVRKEANLLVGLHPDQVRLEIQLCVCIFWFSVKINTLDSVSSE